jgi:hypothetical protein
MRSSDLYPGRGGGGEGKEWVERVLICLVYPSQNNPLICTVSLIQNYTYAYTKLYKYPEPYMSLSLYYVVILETLIGGRETVGINRSFTIKVKFSS